MISDRIGKLRTLMRERNISVYVVPTADYHESEYVSDFFKERKFITGFTGSAGTAVITLEEAGLWTDGRYFIQAEKEIAGTGVALYRMSMEGVPTIAEYIQQKLEKGGCIGFDGRTVNADTGRMYEEMAKKAGAGIYAKEDLIGIIWENRPAFPTSKAYVLEEKYSGKSTRDKLAEVRVKMLEAKADYHVLSDACDIAWLLNVRGDDIRHVPVILSYVIMDHKECYWYVKKENISENILKYLDENSIFVRDYDNIYEDLKVLEGSVLADLRKINYRMKSAMPENVKIIDGNNPEELMKAVKNPTEVKNIINAHRKDGVAVTKFLYWLKTNIGTKHLTELDAAKYLDHLRSEQEGFIDLSFDTISAYGENAAMMHYEPTQENQAVLEPKGFLLVDSGGHYLEGSTDVTRTIALGPLSEEEKRMFTAVARGNLNLANAKFLYGCSGLNLDILARGPLWDMGVDYRCGTGHGNGYLLNVHEGPNGFRWRVVADRRDSGTLEEGMLTTDEPGVYEEGRYGIRTENELICRKSEKNQYGQFMEFENITYVPIDLDAIIPEEMTKRERQLLNDYHKKVYEIIAPYLTEEEQSWLKINTREV